MIQIRLLGSLSVSAREGPVGPAVRQRRPLALLALLASAGARGVSRDAAMLYLWPESTSQRARNTLNQTLYALRRDLRAPDLFVSGPTLSLNQSEIICDHWTFERALARRDLEAAAQEYAGEFLSHFTLPGAPEFERWMEGERSRLAQRYFQAVVTLAERAEERGDHARSTEWWWTLIAQEPLSAIAARGLIVSLAAKGERTAALTFAKSYKDLVASELGIGVDDEVAQLVEHLEAASTPDVPLVTDPQLHRFMEDLSGSERFAELSDTERRVPRRVLRPHPASDAPPPETQDFFRTMVETALDVIYTIDVNGCFTYTNAAGAKLLGLPVSTIRGRAFVEFVRPDFRHSMVEFYTRQIGSRIPITYYEFPVAAPDGTSAWLGQNVQLLWRGEQVVGMLAVARDITLRKRVDRSQHHLAVRDRATRLLNAGAFRLLLEHQVALADRTGRGFLLMFVAIENAQDLHAQSGAAAVDVLISAVGAAVAAAFRRSDAIARLSEDRLGVLAVDFVTESVATVNNRIREGLARELADLPGADPNTVRISATYYDPLVPATMDSLLVSTLKASP